MKINLWFSGVLAGVMILASAGPAHAFYLDVPWDLWSGLLGAKADRMLAQMSAQVPPSNAPGTTQAPEGGNRPGPNMPPGLFQPGWEGQNFEGQQPQGGMQGQPMRPGGDGSGANNAPNSFGGMNFVQPQFSPNQQKPMMPNQSQGNQQSGFWGEGNGFRGTGPDGNSTMTSPKTPRPMIQGQDGQSGSQSGFGGEGNGPQMMGPDSWQPGPDGNGGQPGGVNSFNQTNQQHQPGMSGQDGQDAQHLADIQRGAKQLDRTIKQFDKMLVGAEAKNITVPSEVKDKLEKVRSMSQSLKNAKTVDEASAVAVDELQSLIQELDQYRQETMALADKSNRAKAGVTQMDRALTSFEKQLAKVTTAGVAVPQDVKDNITKARGIITAVKSATSWDQMSAAGIEDLQGIMQDLRDSQSKLDAIAHWPKTLKSIDKELSLLDTAVTRSKSAVGSLAKQGMDIQSVATQLEAGTAKLRNVRDQAKQKMEAGDSEGAFDLLQTDFFGQTDDVWQYRRTIQTMTNLGSFNSRYKKDLADVQKKVKSAKAQKVDVTELNTLINQLQEAGDKVKSLIKATPLDEQAVTEALNDYDSAKQDFDQKFMEVSGTQAPMSWENGPSQFGNQSLPTKWDQLAPSIGGTVNAGQ